MINPSKNNKKFDPVPKYEIEHQEGVCTYYEFTNLFDRFREILNDTDNGIPENLRDELAKVYNKIGSSLESSYILVSTDVSELESRLEMVTEIYYGMEHYDEIYRVLGLHNKEEAIKILQGIQSEVVDSSAGDMFATKVSDTTAELLHSIIEEKIEQGFLPGLETGGSDFDMS